MLTFKNCHIRGLISTYLNTLLSKLKRDVRPIESEAVSTVFHVLPKVLDNISKMHIEQKAKYLPVYSPDLFKLFIDEKIKKYM